LFRRLACFPGSFSLRAAEALGAGGELGKDRVLDVLSHLVRKSLVVREPIGRESRYRLLQTVREYGWDGLQESGEEAILRQLHASFFLDLAEAAEAALMGPAPDVGVRRLKPEDSNFEAALRWALEAGQRELGLRILAVLWRSWDRTGRVAAGRAWLQRFLVPDTPVTPDSVLLRAALGAAVLAFRQGDLVVAREVGERWLPQARGQGDDVQYAFWLVELAHVSMRNRKFDEAKGRFEEGLDLSRKLGIQRLVAACIAGMGGVAVTKGDATQGRPLLEEALEMQRSLNDESEMAGTLLVLGHSWLWSGGAKRARPYFMECSAIWRRLGVSRGIAEAMYGLGHTHMALGDLAQSAREFHESLDIWRDLGNAMSTAECMDGFAMLAALRGQHAQAWRAAGAADGLRDSAGVSYTEQLQAERDHQLEAATRALGAGGRARQWRAGRSGPLEAAIPPALLETVVDSSGLIRLTRRELEVASLIAEGLTNRQIGQRLFITERTAETHVEHILNKLGFHSRTQVATWTIENRPRASPDAAVRTD